MFEKLAAVILLLISKMFCNMLLLFLHSRGGVLKSGLGSYLSLDPRLQQTGVPLSSLGLKAFHAYFVLLEDCLVTMKTTTTRLLEDEQRHVELLSPCHPCQLPAILRGRVFLPAVLQLQRTQEGAHLRPEELLS